MKSYGYLQYDPRHPKTEFESWWALLRCDHGLVEYYKYWIERSAVYSISSKRWFQENDISFLSEDQWKIQQVGFKLNKSAWGPHISVVRGEQPKYPELWNKYKNKKILFEYNPEYINTNGKHWWIRIYSEELEQIRTELGLTSQYMFTDRSDGKFKASPMHLTIAHLAIR